MSDHTIEKSFLYLLVLSLLLHVGVGALLYYLPDTRPPQPKEPVFMDLQNLIVPEKPPEIMQIKPKQVLEQPIKLPKGKLDKQEIKQPTVIVDKNYYTPKGSQIHTESEKGKQSNPSRPAQRQQPSEPDTSASGLFKPKNRQELSRNRADLSLKQSMAKSIEDQINKKLKKEEDTESFGVVDGIDVSLTSFSRRFLKEANDHLVYPPQAKQLGLEARGNIEVTFNRKGEIIDIDITRSGGKDFDESVIDAIKKSVIGPLPKAYKKETSTLRLFYIFRLPPPSER
jgi:protein TonB